MAINKTQNRTNEKMNLNSFLKSNYGTLMIFLFLSVIFISPILKEPKNWGIIDWDQHMGWSYITEQTIKDYHQPPLWSPYMCGGKPFHEHYRNCN